MTISAWVDCARLCTSQLRSETSPGSFMTNQGSASTDWLRDGGSGEERKRLFRLFQFKIVLSLSCSLSPALLALSLQLLTLTYASSNPQRLNRRAPTYGGSVFITSSHSAIVRVVAEWNVPRRECSKDSSKQQKGSDTYAYVCLCVCVCVCARACLCVCVRVLVCVSVLYNSI